MAQDRLANFRARKPVRAKAAVRKARPKLRKVARVAVSAAKRAKVRRRPA